MNFAVNLWGSHPDDDNDDCYTGQDFLNGVMANEVFNNPWLVFDENINSSCTMYIELVTPDGSAGHRLLH